MENITLLSELRSKLSAAVGFPESQMVYLETSIVVKMSKGV